MTDGEKCERDLFFLFLSVATPLLSAKAPVEGAGFGDLELFLEKKFQLIIISVQKSNQSNSDQKFPFNQKLNKSESPKPGPSFVPAQIRQIENCSKSIFVRNTF